MGPTTSLLLSPVTSPEESLCTHTPVSGKSIHQVGKVFLRMVSLKSKKTTGRIHGQSATQISVVIPASSRPQLLRNCIQCLVGQSFDKNFYEIIVVSDGFDDATKNIVNEFKQYHAALYYLYLPVKRGSAATRNLGWQRAWGKLIAFTEDYCLPDKDWLSFLYKIYKGEEVIAYSGTVKVPLPTNPADHEEKISNLETSEFVTANCCCSKVALEKVGGFDERFTMAWREDSDLEFKLIRQHIPVIKVKEALVLRPPRQVSWDSSIKEQKKGIFNALLYKKFPDLYRKKILINRPWNYYMIAVAFVCTVLSFVLSVQRLALVFILCWAALTVNVAMTRLRTTRALNHVAEMALTSILVPFVSVYWQLYGAIKYRTFFL